jgi:hypothetical protein
MNAFTGTPTEFWVWFWRVWAIVLGVTFLVGEGYTLFTNTANTLSAQVWRWEGFIVGESLWQWTAVHFLFCGFMLVLFVWLFFHFGLGIWT